MTGAARGIGLGITRRLGESGARVVMIDVLADELASAAAALKDGGLDVVAVSCDVSNSTAVSATFQRIALDGGLDILVNNAGRFVSKPFLEHTLDQWHDVMQTNLTAVFLCCQQALPQMIERGRGVIINISSLAAFHYTVAHAAYAASKAGIVAVTRELAFEFGPAGIRVVAIAPGAIATQMTQQVADPAVTASLAASFRLGRWGCPEDVGDLVAFLASDRASYMTGQTVTIAGGADLKVLNG